MRSIKHTLTERWYAWENARQDAMQDEEINMYADLDKGERAYLVQGEDDGSNDSGALVSELQASASRSLLTPSQDPTSGQHGSLRPERSQPAREAHV